MLNIIWFLILAAMMTVYAVLDGFDLGVGSLLLALTKSEEERAEALAAIGPVWNGNEVWLLAGGGAMVAAFPTLYATSFSGFYLPLMLVLWLLILRGIGYEFRHFEKSDLWTGACDVAFNVASLLLALLFGVAIGNVLRGVPMDADGNFIGSFAFLLNPFALVAGLLSVSVICLHGCSFLSMRAGGDLKARATKIAGGLCAVSAALTVLLIALSFWARPDFIDNFEKVPALFVLPVLAFAALALVGLGVRQGKGSTAFQGTCLLIVSLLGSAAAGMFPRLLPTVLGDPTGDHTLTIYNAASSTHSMTTALIANVIAMCFVTVYMIFIYRMSFGKPRADAKA
jgi:cytochrome d ubiquinol oxidase subunit II